jgi:hypothetical protein
LTAVFAVGLCVTIPLVVYLILYSIDPTTHFYFDNAKLVPVTNGILIALTVVLILPIFIRRNAVVSAQKSKRRPVVAFFSALTVLALFVLSAYNIAHTFSSTAGASNFLTGISGFLATIFFFTFAVTAFTGKHADLRLIALLPVLWGVVNLVSTFMNLTQIANISEYLYEVLQMVFAILFLYYNARLVGNVSNGREVNGVFAFGLPCALFGLLASLPPIIARCINKTRGSLPHVQDAVFIIMSLYIIALLVSLLIKKPEQAVETPVTEDKPA